LLNEVPVPNPSAELLSSTPEVDLAPSAMSEMIPSLGLNGHHSLIGSWGPSTSSP